VRLAPFGVGAADALTWVAVPAVLAAAALAAALVPALRAGRADPLEALREAR
jgi:putative ABC transport system permease protein